MNLTPLNQKIMMTISILVVFAIIMPEWAYQDRPLISFSLPTFFVIISLLDIITLKHPKKNYTLKMSNLIAFFAFLIGWLITTELDLVRIFMGAIGIVLLILVRISELHTLKKGNQP